MIKVNYTNNMLNSILEIEGRKSSFHLSDIPSLTRNRLRNMSKKKSTSASNKIEGNPLNEEEADSAIKNDDPRMHFLKPEVEIRNFQCTQLT